MDILEILGLILMIGAIAGAVVASRRGGVAGGTGAAATTGVATYVPYLVAFVAGLFLYMLG